MAGGDPGLLGAGEPVAVFEVGVEYLAERRDPGHRRMGRFGRRGALASEDPFGSGSFSRSTILRPGRDPHTITRVDVSALKAPPF